MPLPKTRLDYLHTNDRWVQAVTPDGNDAVILLNVEDNINSSNKAEIIVANRSTNPESSTDTAKGNLVDVFRDFQRIRLVDQETGIIIFHGRIHRIRNKYDFQYGQTIHLYAYSSFRELAQYPLEDPGEILDSLDTTNQTYSRNSVTYDLRKRSEVIKLMLAELDLNDNISIGDANHFEPSWATDSLGDKKLNLSKIERKVLNIAQDLAYEDPLKNESGVHVGESGYDLRAEPYFTSCAADHIPVDMLNYYHRGTRPGIGGAYGNAATPQLTDTSTDSLTIEYPNSSWNGETGVKRAMLSDFEFDRPSIDIYTSVILKYEDQSREDADSELQGVSSKRGIVTFELLKGTSSGSFTWSNKALDASKNTTNIPELINVSGGASGVARAQWNGADHLLVSDITSSFPVTGNITLVGASSGATFTMNAAEGRNSTKYGVKRPKSLSRNISRNLNTIRKEVVSRLIGKTDLVIVKGKYQTVRYPYVYYDLPSNASRSTNTVSWSGTVDAQERGIRKAMIIVEVDSQGSIQRYAYLSNVNSSTSVTYGTGATDTSDGTALNSSNTLRLIVPIRSGDVVKVTNAMAGVNTNQLIMTLTYDEAPGNCRAGYTSIGSNGKFNNIFDTPEAVAAELELAKEKNFSSLVPNSERAFYFSGFVNRGSNPQSSNDYRQIHWSNAAGNTSGTAGVITVSNGEKYNLACGNSPLLTTAEHTIFFRPTKAIADSNKSDTTLQVILTTSYKADPEDIVFGWCKASVNKRGAKAILILLPQIQSQDLFATGMPGGVGEVFLAKSSQKYDSTIDIKPATDVETNTNAYHHLQWAASTLKFADGDSWNIAAGGWSSGNTGSYSYTANGSAFSTNSNLSASFASGEDRTLYAFVDTNDTAAGGTLTLRWTEDWDHISTDSSGSLKTTRIILAMVHVPEASTDGQRAPRVIPMNNRSLVLNAAFIVAGSITAQHIKSTVIDATHIRITGTNGIGGLTSSGLLNLSNTNNNDAITGGARGFLGLNANNRVQLPIGSQEGTAKFFSYGSTGIPGNSGATSLLVLDNLGLVGYSSSSSMGTFPDFDVSGATKQFEIRADNGKAQFGGGTCFADESGLTIKQHLGSNAAGFFAFESTSGSRALFYRLVSAAGYPAHTQLYSAGTSAKAHVFVTYGTDAFITAGTNAGGTTLSRASEGGFKGLYLDGQSPPTPTDNGSGVIYCDASSGKPYWQGRTSGGGVVSAIDLSGGGITEITAGTALTGTALTGPSATLNWSGDELPTTTNDAHADYYVVVSSSGASYKIDVADITRLGSGGGGGSHPSPHRMGDGTETQPMYSFSADTNTGIYRNGDDSLGITADGNQCMRIAHGVTRITGHFAPTTTSYDLGYSGTRWRYIFLVNSPNVSSDEASKENISPISNGLDFISRLNPVVYNRIGETQVDFGFTAQAIKQAALDSGYTEDIGVYTEDTDIDTGITNWGVAYEELIAPLVASIKELKARIEVLEGN